LHISIRETLEPSLHQCPFTPTPESKKLGIWWPASVVTIKKIFREVARLVVKTRLVLDTGEYDKLGLEGVVRRELRCRK
jgi:hypothetical protein